MKDGFASGDFMDEISGKLRGGIDGIVLKNVEGEGAIGVPADTECNDSYKEGITLAEEVKILVEKYITDINLVKENFQKLDEDIEKAVMKMGGMEFSR